MLLILKQHVGKIKRWTEQIRILGVRHHIAVLFNRYCHAALAAAGFCCTDSSDSSVVPMTIPYFCRSARLNLSTAHNLSFAIQ